MEYPIDDTQTETGEDHFGHDDEHHELEGHLGLRPASALLAEQHDHHHHHHDDDDSTRARRFRASYWVDPHACSALCHLILDDRKQGAQFLTKRRPLPPLLYAEHVAPFLRFDDPLPNMLYAIGGRNQWHGSMDSVEMFDTWHGCWVTCPPMPARRAGGGAAVLADGRILVVGGYDQRGIMDGLLSRCDIYNPRVKTWEEAAPLLRPRWGHGCAALNGLVYAVGGCSLQRNAPFSEAFMETLKACEVYHPNENVWKSAPPLHTARSGSRVVAIGDRHLLAVGGCDDVFGQAETQPTTELFDSVHQHWTVLRYRLSQPRTTAAVAALDAGRVVVFGGAPSLSSAEVYRIPPSALCSEANSDANAMAPSSSSSSSSSSSTSPSAPSPSAPGSSGSSSSNREAEEEQQPALIPASMTPLPPRRHSGGSTIGSRGSNAASGRRVRRRLSSSFTSSPNLPTTASATTTSTPTPRRRSISRTSTTSFPPSRGLNLVSSSPRLSEVSTAVGSPSELSDHNDISSEMWSESEEEQHDQQQDDDEQQQQQHSQQVTAAAALEGNRSSTAEVASPSVRAQETTATGQVLEGNFAVEDTPEVASRALPNLPVGRMGCQAAALYLPGVGGSFPQCNQLCVAVVGGERCGSSLDDSQRLEQFDNAPVFDVAREEWRTDCSLIPPLRSPRTAVALCVGPGRVTSRVPMDTVEEEDPESPPSPQSIRRLRRHLRASRELGAVEEEEVVVDSAAGAGGAAAAAAEIRGEQQALTAASEPMSSANPHQ